MLSNMMMTSQIMRSDNFLHCKDGETLCPEPKCVMRRSHARKESYDMQKGLNAGGIFSCFPPGYGCG